MIDQKTRGLLTDGEWNGKIFSGGYRDGRGGIAAVLDKSSGETLGTTGVANAEDVAEACARAYAAAPGWAATPADERAAIMRRAAYQLESARDEIAAWVIRETGGIAAKAGFEIGVASGEFREAAAIAGYETERVIDDSDGVKSVALRVPLGVVGIITPWNVPLILAMRSLAPALATGNTVVLKPDLQTPVVGGFLIAEALRRAGLPDGVLHVLPGDAEAGTALTADPHVAMISFTGSTAVGRLVGEAAGRTLKRVALELGGNAPFIVLDDADIELATSAGAFGSFFHQGQICMASSRHLVHEKIAEAYISRLAERAKAAVVGDPFRTPNALVGPLINDKQLERVVGIVQRSIAAGAKVEAGATHDGRFYAPTVLSAVTPEMPVFTEETFGPVAPVTTFSSDEEGLALANQTEYGLSAAVYTSDLERAARFVRGLRTGLAHVNDQTINDDPRIPFGGMGASGNGGRFGTVSNVEEFTTWRWVTTRAHGHAYPF
jgi:benzaldehyde dehydrogenase (NAD)